MPIFEYCCRECGETVEKIQCAAAEDVECPRCGKPAKRAVSVFSGAVSEGSEGGCSTPAGSGFG